MTSNIKPTADFFIKKYFEIANTLSVKHLLKQIKAAEISSDTIYVFSAKGSRFYTHIFVLLAYELSRRGAQSCFLFKDKLINKAIPIFEYRGIKISGSLKVVKKRLSIESDNAFERTFKRTVACNDELIEIDGINFFPLIRCSLRTRHRRYNINWNDEKIKKDIAKITDTCELLFNYFLLLKDYSSQHKKKVRIIGCEPSYIPNSVFRFLCSLMSAKRDIEFIDFGRGYMQYFGRHFRESFLSAKNNTYEKVDSRHVITKNEFDSFKQTATSQDLFAPLEKVLVRMKSVRMNEKKTHVLSEIDQYRSKGKPVFVLFAHVFFDVGIYDHSSSFPDMCTWIRETVSYFYNKDALLILKPHPSEIKKGFPNKEPAEKLATFLKDTPLSSNILLLDPDLFTLKELYEHITVGLIWRSSVALELACLKVPCIVAGEPPYKILDFTYPSNKLDYFRHIDNHRNLSVSDDLKQNALRYIYYFGKYKNNYIDCFRYDIARDFYYWDRKALKKYLNHGNKEIESLVSKITV